MRWWEYPAMIVIYITVSWFEYCMSLYVVYNCGYLEISSDASTVVGRLGECIFWVLLSVMIGLSSCYGSMYVIHMRGTVMLPGNCMPLSTTCFLFQAKLPSVQVLRSWMGWIHIGFSRWKFDDTRRNWRLSDPRRRTKNDQLTSLWIFKIGLVDTVFLIPNI